METNQRRPQPHPNLDAVAVKNNIVHKVHIFYNLLFFLYVLVGVVSYGTAFVYSVCSVPCSIFFSQNKHCMLSSVVQTNA